MLLICAIILAGGIHSGELGVFYFQFSDEFESSNMAKRLQLNMLQLFLQLFLRGVACIPGKGTSPTPSFQIN